MIQRLWQLALINQVETERMTKKKLLILGAGTAGTMAANRLYRELDRAEWQITVVDQEATHYYQPGFLFIPFGTYQPEDVIKRKESFLPDGVELIFATIDRVDPETNEVFLGDTGQVLNYDYLIIATGTSPRPEETPGMVGPGWRQTVHDFYTFDGAVALGEALRDWEGGRLVVAIMEMPIKCPVAPLEFTFLADDFFRRRGMRDRVDITFVTPLPGAFTKPRCERVLSHMLGDKGVQTVTEFNTERVDQDARLLVAYDETEIAYDLLVTVPVNMGADFVARSGLGDELNHVPVDRHTLLSSQHSNLFALGDAAALPTSKAGSVAHFAVETFVDNFIRHVNGQEMEPIFDGHANCFIESGDGKAILIDFNYEVEPLPGKYPLPGVGPFSLLKETRVNHLGKLAFRWLYWNVLLPGRPMPVSATMSMAGKIAEPVELTKTPA